MKKINILLIGVGYHAKRIYVPFLQKTEGCNLAACYDLLSEKDKIEYFLSKNKVVTNCYYTDDTSISDSLNDREVAQLQGVVAENKIDAVIIATEPLAHFKYAMWALENNLHILMDKPITTELNVSTDMFAASKLFSDYKRLLNLYKKKRESGHLVFTLQAQRRFHAGFKAARGRLIEIYDMTNCPVTSVQSFHSDGQWRFPKEIVEQNYHPYNQGYGKMSHSGYHSLDISLWFAEAAIAPAKQWDNYALWSQFVRPSDLMAQFNKFDYLKLFPDMPKGLLNTKIVNKAKAIMGEVDSYANISLKHGSQIVTSVMSSCLHNGFGQRSWFSVEGKDLYKGNGRIRQESYIIEQGPFQCVVINSFQSEEILKDSKEGVNPYGVGGEYHFDIHVFRNSALFPKLKSYELINIHDLSPVQDKGYSSGHNEKARGNGIDEFIKSIMLGLPESEQSSSIVHHSLSTQLLSAIYVSAANQISNKSGVIRRKIML